MPPTQRSVVMMAGLPRPLPNREVCVPLWPSSLPGAAASPFQISAGEHRGS